MNIWVFNIKLTLLRGPKTGTNFPKKIEQLLAKLHSLWQVHFVVAILFVLTFASDRAVLNGNVFLILAVSTKKQYSSFFIKVFVFQKVCFKIKVLKTCETFTDLPISKTESYFENP